MIRPRRALAGLAGASALAFSLAGCASSTAPQGSSTGAAPATSASTSAPSASGAPASSSATAGSSTGSQGTLPAEMAAEGATLDADGTVVFGASSSQAVRVDCGGLDLRLERETAAYQLTGRCGSIAITADMAAVEADEIGTLEVSSSMTSVHARRIDAISISGTGDSVAWSEGVPAASVDAGGDSNTIAGP